jgi:hypothetical protein
MTTMKSDPGLDAVRSVRSRISREFDNDPVRLIAHYVEMQAQYQGGLLVEGPGGAALDEGELSSTAAQQGDATAGAARRS